VPTFQPIAVQKNSGDVGSVSNTFNNAVIVPKPTNTADGDLLVAFIYGQAGGSTVTPPSGWTLVATDNSVSPRAMYIGVKPIPSAAAETATSYNFGLSTNMRNCGVIFRVTGANLADPVDVVESAMTGYLTGGNPVGSITTTNDGDLILQFIWTNDASYVTGISFADTFGSPDVGVVATPASGNTSAIDVLYYVQTSAGATSTSNTIVRTPAPANGRVIAVSLNADPANVTLTADWSSTTTLGASGAGPQAGTAAWGSSSAMAASATVPRVPPTLLLGGSDSTTATNSSGIPIGGHITGNKPANTQDGDLLLAFVVAQTTLNNTTERDTIPPAGWTRLGPAQTDTGAFRPVGVWALPVPSAAALTATSWDWGNASLAAASRMIVVIARVINADISSITDDGHTAMIAGSIGITQVVYTGLTTTLANDLVLGIAHATGTAAMGWPVYTTPSPLTKVLDVNTTSPNGSGSGDNLYVATNVYTSPGSVGTLTLTASVAQSALSGFLVAIRGRTVTSQPNTAAWGSSSAMGSSAVSTAPSIAPTSISSMGFSPKYVYGSRAAMSSATSLGAAFLNPVQAFLRDLPMYVSHRGGDGDWVQNTTVAYANSVAWSRKLALEVSIVPTSDGFFMLSDSASTDAAFGTTGGDIRTQTKAQLKLLRTTVGGYPPMFFDEDILPVYGGPSSANPRVIFLDNKYANNVSAVLDTMDANGGPAWWVCKAGGTTSSWPVAAKARGYTCWGYWFPTDTAAGNLNATTAGRFDLLGLQYNDTDAQYTAAAAFGKPLLSHVIFSQANATAAFSHPGVTVSGLMVAGIMEVVPGDVHAAMQSASAFGAAATVVQRANVAAWGSSTAMSPHAVIQKTGAAAMASTSSLAASGIRIAFAHGPAMSSHTAFAAAVKYIDPETVAFRSVTAFLARYATVRSAQTMAMVSTTSFPNIADKRTTHGTTAMLSSTAFTGSYQRSMKAGSRMTSVSRLAFARSIIAGTASMTSVSSMHGTAKRATTGHLGFTSVSAFALSSGTVRNKEWLVMRSATAFAASPTQTSGFKIAMFSHTSMHGLGEIALTIAWQSVILWDPPAQVTFLESVGMISATQATFFASPVSSIRPFPLSARLTSERLTSPSITASLTSGRADTT
jgi:hypothetical protein